MDLAINKRVLHDYNILKTFEAGIVLSGPEVKSVKTGRMNLKGSYAMIDGNGNAWLLNAHIAPYPPAAGAQRDYEPTHSRKLLLRRAEIADLTAKLRAKGLTIMPLKVYIKRRFIKIDLGLARGKKEYDKRETLKKRDAERDIRQALKKDLRTG